MGARGPLPNPNRRRRNAPTIPTTDLPAAGREGPTPDCPYALNEGGAAWWEWAWHTPQAEAWDDGALYTIARRAQLEDDVRAIEGTEAEDLLAGLVGRGKNAQAAARELSDLLGRVKAIASARTTILREMREIDDRLGLSPKGLAALRWRIVKALVEEPEGKPATVRRLHAVDPKAAAGG